jgi:outer membrane receptor protein involved in Fe transport
VGKRRIFGRALFPTAIACLAIASPARSQSADVTVHIPSEPLADALIDFAVQAKVSISDTGIDFQGAVSRPVDGTYSRFDALKRLLAFSGFDFRFVDAASVEIRMAAHPGVALPVAAPDIESVIVTATKREERAQDLPYSLAVVSGEHLESFGVGATHELTSQFAGLTATNLGPGEDKLFVRGLTDSVLPGLSESVVGVYLDESRIVDDAPDPNLQMVDMEQVEILRGPQGPLYGAGSLAGLLHIVTRKPVNDSLDASVEATTSATEDGGLSTDFAGMLNVPIVPDRLAARLVAYTDEDAGYVDNVRLHTSDTNRTSIDGGRLAVGLVLDATWTVLANLTLQDTRSRDSQYYIEDLGAYERDNYLPEPHADRFLEGGVTANAAWGWADLVSNTSYVDRSYKTQFDASDAWPTLTGFPIGPSPFNFRRVIDSYTHETRLVSAEGRAWQWLAGVFLDHRDEDFASGLSGPGAGLSNVLARAETREDRLNEAALFGEASYALAPGFTFTAGARAFTAAHAVGASSLGLLVGAPEPASGRNSQSGVAPKFVLKYEPDSDTTLYAQFSEGYRLGGINVDSPAGATEESGSAFKSDNLRNYEIGAKLNLFDGRLTANAAAYFEDWSDVQADEIAPDGAFYIVNAGKVSDPGFEIDFGTEPLENLELQGNFFWNDASLAQSSPLIDAAESGLPGAPSVSAALSAAHSFALTSDIKVFARMSDAYVGSSHLGFSQASPGMGNYNVASVRMGMSRGAWQMTLFVDNLTDDRGNTFAFGNPFSSEKQITPPRPRTVGVSLSWTL